MGYVDASLRQLKLGAFGTCLPPLCPSLIDHLPPLCPVVSLHRYPLSRPSTTTPIVSDATAIHGNDEVAEAELEVRWQKGHGSRSR